MKTVITLSLDDQEQIGRPTRLEVTASDLEVSATVLEDVGRVPVADVLIEHREGQLRVLIWTQDDLPAYGCEPSHEIVLVPDTTRPLAVPALAEV